MALARGPRVFLVIAVACAMGNAVGALELQSRTVQEYDAYVSQAKAAFVAHEPDVDAPDRGPRLARGAVLTGPAREDGIIEVSDGLIHDWTGSAFVPNVTLTRMLETVMAYDRYSTIYGPIVRSTLVDRADDVFHVAFRVKASVASITTVVDLTSHILYAYPEPHRVDVFGTSDEIREVRRAGRADERRLPPGEGSGFLWRANVFTEFIERDGGVYVRMETLALSRRFPALLAWAIEPIVRRVGRNAMESSLIELRTAVVGTSPGLTSRAGR